MSGAAKNGIIYVYTDGGSTMRLAGGLWNNNQIAFNWIFHYVYVREGWAQHRYHDVELSDPPILLSFFVFFPQFHIFDTLWVQSWESYSSALCFHMAVAMNGSKGVFFLVFTRWLHLADTYTFYEHRVAECEACILLQCCTYPDPNKVQFGGPTRLYVFRAISIASCTLHEPHISGFTTNMIYV